MLRSRAKFAIGMGVVIVEAALALCRAAGRIKEVVRCRVSGRRRRVRESIWSCLKRDLTGRGWNTGAGGDVFVLSQDVEAESSSQDLSPCQSVLIGESRFAKRNV